MVGRARLSSTTRRKVDGYECEEDYRAGEGRVSKEAMRADILAIAEWYARLIKVAGQEAFDSRLIREIDKRASLLGGRFADKRIACESVYADLLNGAGL